MQIDVDNKRAARNHENMMSGDFFEHFLIQYALGLHNFFATFQNNLTNKMFGVNSRFHGKPRFRKNDYVIERFNQMGLKSSEKKSLRWKRWGDSERLRSRIKSAKHMSRGALGLLFNLGFFGSSKSQNTGRVVVNEHSTGGRRTRTHGRSTAV